MGSASANTQPPNSSVIQQTAYFSPYLQQTTQALPGPVSTSLPLLTEPVRTEPLWWTQRTATSFWPNLRPLPCNVDSLTLQALRNSPQVKAIREIGPIQATAVPEAQAEFDWIHFLEARYEDLSEPVGSLLTTGNSIGRFQDHHVTARGGLRQKTQSGGQVEISQQAGYQDSNSQFLNPNPQGTARLSLSYTQPLLNRAGQTYNSARVVLATLDTEVAHQEVCEQLNDVLFSVSEAYWTLYQARSAYLQQRRVQDWTTGILRLLEARRDIDATGAQIVRARAAIAARRSRLVRSESAIHDAETRLRALLGSTQLPPSGQYELLPIELPANAYVGTRLPAALQTAMHQRPDIAQAFRQVTAASVKAGVSKQDLLPKLDLVLESHVSGLDGNSNSIRAFENQFNRREPSFSIGLLFEMPLGNRAQAARHERQTRELQQAVYRLHATIEAALAEVEIAARDIETSYSEMQARLQSLSAAELDLRYLGERWGLLTNDDRSGSLLLEQVLGSWDRLQEEEAALVAAQVRYTLALTALKRQTGTALGRW